MKPNDHGIIENSECFSFLPSEIAETGKLYHLSWIGHYFCSSRYYKERDYFPDALLMYIRNGEMEIRYEGEEYTATSGDIVLLNCQKPHYYHAKAGLEFLYIHYNGTSSHFLTDFLIENNKSSRFRTENNSTIERELMTLMALFLKGTHVHPVRIDYWIRNIIQLLYRAVIEPIEEDSPIDQAVRYIKEHAHEEITLEELAELTGFSTFYFSHRFKHETGYAPRDFVIHVRLEEAQALLKHSNRSVEEIAFDLGYSSLNSFTNIFRKKVGCSPAAYRKMSRNKIQGPDTVKQQ